jgi:hypothetical protein
MKNVITGIFSIYELLLSQKLGDWVKAQFTTCYSQLFMTRYDDKRWIYRTLLSQ